MTYLVAQPQVMATAAAEVAAIGSAIDDATATAGQQIVDVASAAADEVSAATARLFNAYGRDYEAVLRQAAALHGEFAEAWTAAATAYEQTEAATVRALTETTSTTVAAIASEAPPFTFPANYTSVFISGSGDPIPSASYMSTVFTTYILPNFPGGSSAKLDGLFTPAGLYPLTGTKVLTLAESVAQGVQILDSTLVGPNGLIQPGGNPVVVQGISQGAIIASLEMQKLAAMTSPPTANELGFVLLGDPMNPNGGLFARFAGLGFPSLGQTFYGATPSDTPWPTTIYSLEYDGISNWPRYPINILADLNAFAGFYYVHSLYPSLDPAALPSGYSLVQLPTSPGYAGNTTYYVITIPHLPLLEPVRAIPLVGDAIADLVEPNLRVLVNLGYGDPAYGYSTSPADVPTPFGLLPHVDPHTVLTALVAGTQQGVSDAASDLSGLSLSDVSDVLTSHFSPSLPSLSLPSWSSVDDFITAVQTANTNFTNDVSTNIANAVAKVQPTIDIANALLTSVPSYELNLFLDGISEMVNGAPAQGLVNAIGMPIAAHMGLVTLLGGYELFVLTGAWYA
jgi:hypothetical protein